MVVNCQPFVGTTDGSPLPEGNFTQEGFSSQRIQAVARGWHCENNSKHYAAWVYKNLCFGASGHARCPGIKAERDRCYGMEGVSSYEVSENQTIHKINTVATVEWV